jgi:hypothetical protein
LSLKLVSRLQLAAEFAFRLLALLFPELARLRGIHYC